MQQAHALWYFDFVSPFAYLQWQRLRRMDIALEPVPLLLAALLEANGTKGPAEIPSKRVFTYRFVQWRAGRDGIPLRFPPAHPFNPLAALRLCLAAGATPESVTAIYAHLWRDGLAGDTAAALAPVAAGLGIADAAAAIAAPEPKAKLRANTEQARAAGVFGVPTVAIDGQLFWGDDATAMLEDFLSRPAMFAEPEMARIASLPVAASRI